MGQRTRTLVGSLCVCVALAFSGIGGAHAEDYWQCAAFARVFSGIQIFGDAWTWWQKATGHYLKGDTPKAGAVLVFKPQGVMKLGHVAVVSQVLTDRVIQISHANWSLIDGERGHVERNVTVVDVSPNGDWSEVKVWNDPSHNLGGTVYPTFGFIYNAPAQNAPHTTTVAQASDAAVAMAQTAAGQVVNAVRPGATPLQILNQAADSTDRIAALIQAAAGGDAPADGKH